MTIKVIDVISGMIDSGAVAEIGTSGFALVATIAMQEDKIRYLGKVNFWNTQLMTMLGIKDDRTLNAVRKAAIDAGWLDYQSRNKKSGKYLSKLPMGSTTSTKNVLDDVLDHVPDDVLDHVPPSIPIPVPSPKPEPKEKEDASPSFSDIVPEPKKPKRAKVDKTEFAYHQPEPKDSADCERIGKTYYFPEREDGGGWYFPKAHWEQYLEVMGGSEKTFRIQMDKMSNWLMEHPAKWKTYKDMHQFVLNWIKR